MVDAAEDGELAADMVQLVDVVEIGFDEHFLALRGQLVVCPRCPDTPFYLQDGQAQPHSLLRFEI